MSILGVDHTHDTQHGVLSGDPHRYSNKTTGQSNLQQAAMAMVGPILYWLHFRRISKFIMIIWKQR